MTVPKVSRGDVLESIYRHRLLSSGQLHEMHWPEKNQRSTRAILTRLKEDGLVGMLRATDGHGSLYYLTQRGIDVVEQVSPPPSRRKALTRVRADGPLRAHTLAVNDTAIAFMKAARERGEDFDSRCWDHEVTHPIGRNRKEWVRADALLTYSQPGIISYRLLELDRATETTDKLAEKLASYARLYRYTRPSQSTPAWKARYPDFPGILCVLDGASRAALERRAETVLSLCDDDRELRRTPQVEISLCLLDDLLRRGPFAAIWQRPDSQQMLDWLGNPAGERSAK